MQPKEKYDLIGRTQQNLNYISTKIGEKKIPLNNQKFYEVTNLINNGLGLISYVYQFAEDKAKEQHEQDTSQDIFALIHNFLMSILSSVAYDKTRYGEIIVCYPHWTPKDVSTTEISAILYRMRNSICHCGIELIGGKPDEHGNIYIEKIRFLDGDNTNRRFEAIMTIKQFYNLLVDTAEAYAKYIKQSSLKNP